MSVKIILKNPPQQNYVNIFLAGLISTIWTFDGMANKHDVCRSEDCMKQFCNPLREQAMQIIDFEKKENDVINKQSINHILIKKLSHLKK